MSKHNLSHLPMSNLPSLPNTQEQHMPYSRPCKRQKTTPLQDRASVGNNIARFSQGIFNTPYPEHRAPLRESSPACIPSLPPRDAADTLLMQYHQIIHPTLPIVHWRSLQERYEGIYRDDTIHKPPSAWFSLLFAIFACGTLHRSWSDGQRYLELSKSFMNLWTEIMTLDHARAALLNALFSVESNNISAGWLWMGIAVRISFDLGLDCEVGTWNPVEEEMRRRVWWSIYTGDWSVLFFALLNYDD